MGPLPGLPLESVQRVPERAVVARGDGQGDAALPRGHLLADGAEAEAIGGHIRAEAVRGVVPALHGVRVVPPCHVLEQRVGSPGRGQVGHEPWHGRGVERPPAQRTVPTGAGIAHGGAPPVGEVVSCDGLCQCRHPLLHVLALPQVEFGGPPRVLQGDTADHIGGLGDGWVVAGHQEQSYPMPPDVAHGYLQETVIGRSTCKQHISHNPK